MRRQQIIGNDPAPVFVRVFHFYEKLLLVKWRNLIVFGR